MPPLYFLKVDDVDLETLGFTVREASGLFDSAPISYLEQAVYARPGAELIDDDPVVGARDIVVSGTAIADTDAELKGMLDQIRAHVNRGEKRLVYGNSPTLLQRARYTGITGGPLGPQLAQRKAPIDLHFRALTPYAEDAAPTTLSDAADTPIPLPQGTAPTRGVATITFAADATTVTVIYRDSEGNPIATLSCTGAFTAGDVLAIDNDLETITLNGDAADELLDNDSEFIEFDHGDGDFGAEEWPTIEADQPISVTYARRWE